MVLNTNPNSGRSTGPAWGLPLLPAQLRQEPAVLRLQEDMMRQAVSHRTAHSPCRRFQHSNWGSRRLLSKSLLNRRTPTTRRLQAVAQAVPQPPASTSERRASPSAPPPPARAGAEHEGGVQRAEVQVPRMAAQPARGSVGAAIHPAGDRQAWAVLCADGLCGRAARQPGADRRFGDFVHRAGRCGSGCGLRVSWIWRHEQRWWPRPYKLWH